MAFRCEDIVNISGIGEVRLLAGEPGLHREIRWYYIADALDDLCQTVEWLIGNELVIFTGCNIGKNPSKTICDLLVACSSKNIAGLIVNTGEYISEVPQEAIDLADRLEIPLFEMPWEIHLVEFTRLVSEKIIDAGTKKEDLQKHIGVLLFGDDKSKTQSQSYLEMRLGSAAEVPFRISLYSINAENDSDGSESKRAFKLMAISGLLEQRLRILRIPSVVTRLGEYIFLLTSGVHEKALFQSCHTTVIALFEQIEPDCVVTVSIGPYFIGLENMLHSYNAAKNMFKIIGTEPLFQSILFSEDLGLYRILLEAESTSVLREYYNDLFAPLIDYDRNRDSDLFCTLETYCFENARLGPTAKKLHVHINTLKYRLKRIEEIAKVDLSQVPDLARIFMGIKIGRYLRKQDTNQTDNSI